MKNIEMAAAFELPDTHSFLWFITGDNQLPEKSVKLIDDSEILPIDFSHTKKLLKLEHHHHDPFDRMIISQAIAEKLVIVTKDRFFKEYKDKVIW